MKIFIGDNNQDELEGRHVVKIEEITEETIDEILKVNRLAVVVVGEEVSELALQMVNSRPNPRRPLTQVQTHDDVIVLLNKDGAKHLYE